MATRRANNFFSIDTILLIISFKYVDFLSQTSYYFITYALKSIGSNYQGLTREINIICQCLPGLVTTAHSFTIAKSICIQFTYLLKVEFSHSNLLYMLYIQKHNTLLLYIGIHSEYTFQYIEFNLLKRYADCWGFYCYHW